MTLQKRMVLQRRANYRIKGRKDKLIRCLPVSLSFRLLQTTYSQIIGVCKYFCAVQSWHMLFWLLKDAWLTCNGCSFSVLPTPFWSPIKHLLQTTYSHIIGGCKLFSCNQSLHMLFWLLKDAWLTCNRCSFSVLPTPFWSPIRHLLRTIW